MGITKKQKENIAKIFINVGSITFGGVVLGYFVSENKISGTEFIVGIAAVAIACFISILIDK